MGTKLIDSIFIEEESMIAENKLKETNFKKAWIDFLDNSLNNNLAEANMIFQSFKTFEKLLKERWIELEDELLFDSKINACWLYKKNEETEVKDLVFTKNYSIHNNESQKITLKEMKNFSKKYKIELDFPSKKELQNSLTLLTEAPFPRAYHHAHQRPNSFKYALFIKTDNSLKGFNLDKNYLSTESFGAVIPLFRLHKKNSFNLTNQELFFLFVFHKLVPIALKEDKKYNTLLLFNYELSYFESEGESFFNIEEITIEEEEERLTFSEEIFLKNLLEEDKLRADIQPYHEKMLDDIEQGHWSLWQDESSFTTPMKLELNKKLVARNPKSSIVNGVVGIDFGTKSTVVAYQKESTKIFPMRVGTGKLNKGIDAQHYENPTIMEFNNLWKFMEDYYSREGRPLTSWQDVTISHTAFSSLMNSKSDDFNSFMAELKQWAGTKGRKFKLVDKQGYDIDLPPFLELNENDINPIEMYAYYLGLYINNQHNGIFMNYILSFPVTYELEIRDKIIDSFYKGIKKSLPQELHNQPEELAKLSIKKGASEPAAYAIVALKEYDFDPIDDEKVFYGVFDFGGGTTDFDFGIYREATGRKERRYDFVIEHFGAGGDRYLGGENLLELLAFELFKKNKENLLAKNIQFILPPECDEFLGSEMLLSQSREAKMNTKTLMEKLRPFWEQHEDSLEEFDKGVIEVNLTTIDGQNLANFELDSDQEEMFSILEKRIEKGVINFFESLRLAFNHNENNLNDIDKVNIFLAGNSSKSALVDKLFKAEIERIKDDIKEQNKTDKEFFKIFPPLGNSEKDLTKPTGKTGVAFGLIESREGGNVLVLDHNVKENINFKYYLGENRRRKFKVILDREHPYNEWVEFIDASQETFEIYYSSQALVSTNNAPIDDSSIKRKILKIDKIDDEALIYIRTVSPTELEYVVAHEEAINNSEYLNDIVKIAL